MLSLLFAVFLVLVAWGVLVLPFMRLWSHLSGWGVLAERFPRVPFAAPSSSTRRGWTGWITLGQFASYNGGIIWAADDDHLHLRLWPIFPGTRHPPISIPWAAIEFLGPARPGAVRVRIEGGTYATLPRFMVRNELALRSAMAANCTASPPEDCGRHKDHSES